MTRTASDVQAWMPLYIGDWAAATAHLSCEEDGAYGRLVRWYWRNGAPSDSDALLAKIAGVTPSRWRKLRPAVAPFFAIEGGRWLHRRVERELARAEERYRRRAEAGRKGGSAGKQCLSNAEAGLKQSQSQSHPFGILSQGEVNSGVGVGSDARVIALRREDDR